MEGFAPLQENFIKLKGGLQVKNETSTEEKAKGGL